MEIFILRGLPGSGKSTWAKARYPDALVVSADHYFQREGEYKFDPRLLGEAHASCLRRYVRALQEEETSATVVVDNTNLSLVEIAPYAAVAEAFALRFQVVTVQCDPFVAAGRNVHGVPHERYAGLVARMAAGTEELKTQRPWWPHRVEEVPTTNRR